MKYNLITILGPTAVGKTRLAALLADKFDGEIISADSRQVYKGMDIGTGKDLADYIVNGKAIPYHLIDVIEPGEEFNIFLFQQNFYNSFGEIVSRGKIPFLVGGTGMYLHSILGGYDLPKVEFDKSRYDELNKLDVEKLKERLMLLNPKLHNTTDLLVKDRIIRAIMIVEGNSVVGEINRAEIKPLVLGVRLEREKIKERITARLKQRLQNGMIDEVKNLLKGVTFERLELFGLEYKFIARYLKGELNYNDMYQKLNSAIHSFAKRQMTWFKRDKKIHWINNFKEADKLTKNFVN